MGFFGRAVKTFESLHKIFARKLDGLKSGQASCLSLNAEEIQNPRQGMKRSYGGLILENLGTTEEIFFNLVNFKKKTIFFLSFSKVSQSHTYMKKELCARHYNELSVMTSVYARLNKRGIFGRTVWIFDMSGIFRHRLEKMYLRLTKKGVSVWTGGGIQKSRPIPSIDWRKFAFLTIFASLIRYNIHVTSFRSDNTDRKVYIQLSRHNPKISHAILPYYKVIPPFSEKLDKIFTKNFC